MGSELLLAGSPVALVLAKLERAKSVGKGSWMALCPAHEDRNPSLSISEGRDGRVLLKCHAGCAVPAIVAAIGLTVGDLYVPDPAKSATITRNGSGSSETAVLPLQRPIFEKSYDYVDEDGALLFQVCRFRDQVSGKKQFRQRRRGEGNEWIYNRGDARLVLYHLPQLIEALALDRQVFIVEGEKDVETLESLGYVATTNAGGAGKWSEEYSRLFDGADVIIAPDNDEAGESHANQVAASLTAAGARVRILKLPDLPPKGDVTDWMATHDGPALAEQLAAAPAWEPPTATGLPRAQPLSAVKKPEPITWCVEELLIASELAVFAGVGGSYKSTCALHLAAAVAGGNSVFNRFPAKPRPVFVLSAEDSDGVVKNRVEAICRGHGWDAEQILDNIHLIASHEAKLSDPKWQQHLVEECQRLDVGLVVLDPWADLITGEENSNSEQRPVIAFCRKLTTNTSAAVVVVAHVTKAREGLRPIDRIRGAGALRDAARCILLFEDRPEGIAVEHLKMSRSEKLLPFTLTREIESTPESKAIWESAKFAHQSTHDAVVSLAETFVLNAITAAPGELNSTGVKAAGTAQHHRGEDVSKALVKLQEAGLITFIEGFRGAKFWTPTTLPNGAGRVEIDLAHLAQTLPGKVKQRPADPAHLAAPSGRARQGGQEEAGQGGQGHRRYRGRRSDPDDPPPMEELEL